MRQPIPPVLVGVYGVVVRNVDDALVPVTYNVLYRHVGDFIPRAR